MTARDHKAPHVPVSGARGLLDLVDQAVVVCDAAGVVEGFNAPAVRFFPGLRAGESLEAPWAGPMASAAGRGADRFDADFAGRRLSGHRERHDGRAVWLVSDVSDRRDCEMRLTTERDRSAFLEQAGRRLSASFHHGRTVRALVRVGLPSLADAAIVVLPLRGRRTVWHRAGPGDGAESGAVAARALGRVPEVAEALEGLRPAAVVVPGGKLDELALVPEELRGDGEALVLQLPGDAVPAGALVLVRGPRRPGFRAADVELAHGLAERGGLALAAAALYSRQAHTTAVLQANLAPEPLPAVDGIRLGAAYRPAAEALRISGDFYHVAPCPNGAVGFFFGDVCGKGAEAAVLAGLVRQSLRTLSPLESDPVGTLRLLNEALLDDHSRFTTLVNGWARPAPDGGLTVLTAGGGHLPPLVLRADGRVEEVEIGGTLVGVLPDPVFDSKLTRLRPGELMLLYSDGVTEARGGPGGYDPYGDERLARALATCVGMPAGAVAERVEILTTQWLAGRPHDDIAVLALQAPPHRAGPTERAGDSG